MTALDTSGAVYMPKPTPNTMMPGRFEWSMFSPFEQGYVEALLQGEARREAPGSVVFVRPIKGFAFADLAPETLSTIRTDCADWIEKALGDALDARRSPYAGRDFWIERQDGRFPLNFPVLTVTLSDAGKVALK